MRKGAGASGAVGWPVGVFGGLLLGGILFGRLVGGFDDDFAEDAVVGAEGFGEVGDYAFGV